MRIVINFANTTFTINRPVESDVHAMTIIKSLMREGIVNLDSYGFIYYPPAQITRIDYFEDNEHEM